MENYIIDEQFESKYVKWLELSQPPVQEPNNEPIDSIMQEDEIKQIAQLAQSLGLKGYEFELFLEPRCSYKKHLIANEYYQGPFKISTSSLLLKPLELQTYENFDSIYSAVKKCCVGIHCKYNAKNLLIYKFKEDYNLGYRCHKCDSFLNVYNIKKNNRDINLYKHIDKPDYSMDISSIPEIPELHLINHSIFCSSCKAGGLTEKERAFEDDVNYSTCARINKKHLSLDWSSGGSVSMVYTVGRIYPVK